jgi:tetratricopeptide (TPR) repeat protein
VPYIHSTAFGSPKVTDMGIVLKKGVLLVTVLLALAGNGKAGLDNKALFDNGVAAFKEGRFQDAVNLFSELISVTPDDAKLYKNRGVALMNLSEIDLAIADFTKAISLNPELKGLHSNLGAAWHYKGEYEKAIACYDADIAQRPDLYITYFNRALSKAGLNQLDMALVDMERTLQLKPDFEAARAAKKDLQGKLREITARKYAVQTGAFLVEKNALEMKEVLVKKGYDATVASITDSKQRIWHVVRFEKDLDRENAEKICRQLKERENIVAIVRPVGKL